MQYLGIDEQAEALPFVRLFDPTDLQRVGWKMGGIIEGNHSWDWLNPTVWRVVGLESSNVIEWLKRYIEIARQWRLPLTHDTAPQFQQHFIEQYGYSASDLDEYFDAFWAVREQGLMPDSIYMPWEYQPTTVSEDIGQAVSKALSPKLIILAVLGVGAYAFFSRGLPRMTLSK